MSSIGEFIQLALELSGLAFNPVQGSVIIDMEMKYLCCFDQKSLQLAAASHTPLHPVDEGSGRNCIFDNSGDYLQWNNDLIHSQIIAIKAPSTVECFDTNGTKLDSFKVESKYPVYNAFLSTDNKQVLCIHSKPVNPDFEETGAGIFNRSTGTYRTSSVIHSQELAVRAAWNSKINSWIICDNYRKKLYSWKADAPDAMQLGMPPDTDSAALEIMLDDSGSAVTVYYYNERNGSYVFYKGDITSDLIKWHAPLSVKTAESEFISIDISGTRIAFLEATMNSHSLHIVNTSDTEKRLTVPVPEKCTGYGIGWISKSAILCAGSDCLMMLDLSSQGSAPKGKYSVKH